ncbi:MAG: addiction module protein [Kiritimatiellae bacterium]|jgi:putative addiction module component (TIGR02574 family)|nr:addiction module protein [Kiritimatiellia bacterium]
MTPELMECEAQALQLPLAKRAELAEHLIASLDEIDEVQNEQLWLDEADRRYNEYKKGNISARCAEDVLQYARDIIK